MHFQEVPSYGCRQETSVHYKVGFHRAVHNMAAGFPTVNNWGKEDRQRDKHTEREAVVSFYKFGSNLLSLLLYWSHRPTLVQWRRGHARVVPEGRAHRGPPESLATTVTESVEVGETEFYWILLEPLEHPCFV